MRHLIFFLCLSSASVYGALASKDFQQLLDQENLQPNPYMLKFDRKSCHSNLDTLLAKAGISSINEIGKVSNSKTSGIKFENFLKDYVKSQIIYGLSRISEINPTLARQILGRVSIYRKQKRILDVHCDFALEGSEGELAGLHVKTKTNSLLGRPELKQTIYIRGLIPVSQQQYQSLNSGISLASVIKLAPTNDESDTIFHEYLHAIELPSLAKHNRLKPLKESDFIQPVGDFLLNKIAPLYVELKDKVETESDREKKVSLMHYNAYWARHPEIKDDLAEKKRKFTSAEEKSVGGIKPWYFFWKLKKIEDTDVVKLISFFPALGQLENSTIEKMRLFETITVANYHKVWLDWLSAFQKKARDLITDYQQDAVYSCSFYAFESGEPYVETAMRVLYEKGRELFEAQNNFNEGLKNYCASVRLDLGP